jgi:3D (Asp-Asp-Asp) domain-containing protein
MRKLLTYLLLHVSGRIVAMAVLVAATLTLPAPLASLNNARHTYLLQGEGEPTYIYGTAQEEADYGLLTAAPNRSDAIGDAQLCLSGDQTVTLTAGEETVSLDAKAGETVDHLLRRADLTPSDQELVVLDLRGEALEIHVTDSWNYSWIETVPTTYTTERVASKSMTRGTEKVKQEGQNGHYDEFFTSLYTAEGYQGTEKTHQSPDTAVTEIIEYGTAAPVTSVRQGERVVEVHPNEDGTPGGYLVLSSGETVAYKGVDTYEATAYCIHGTTATGYPTAMGVVAVDPKVIPYGTRMYIQTPSGGWVYGMSVARDCGGAIKGKIIDLWFPDYETCVKWGRRNITVYFLG